MALFIVIVQSVILRVYSFRMALTVAVLVRCRNRSVSGVRLLMGCNSILLSIRWLLICWSLAVRYFCRTVPVLFKYLMVFRFFPVAC